MNTSLHDLISVIESVKFDAYMSVFSGFNSFFRALAGNQTIQELLQLLIDFPSTNEQILARLMILLEEHNDPQYEHPHDIAIASYLYVLSSSVGLSVMAAERILTTPNVIWAKRLAEEVLEGQTATIQSEIEIIQPDTNVISVKPFDKVDYVIGSNNINMMSSDVVTASIKVENEDDAAYPVSYENSLIA